MNLLNALNTNTYSYNANRIKTEKKTIPKINNNIYTQHQNNLLTSFAVRVYLVWRSWKTLFCLHKRRARMLLCDLSDDTECMCVCVSVYINYMVFAVYFKIHKTTLTLAIHKTIYADFVSLDSFLGKCIRTLVYKHIRTLRKKTLQIDTSKK